MLTGREYDGPPQDIWALGILLYTLIYRENPFYNINEILSRDLRIPYILSEGMNTHIWFYLCVGQRLFIIFISTTKLFLEFSIAIIGSIDLIKKMLSRNIDKRPTIFEVLNHPWLEE